MFSSLASGYNSGENSWELHDTCDAAYQHKNRPDHRSSNQETMPASRRFPPPQRVEIITCPDFELTLIKLAIITCVGFMHLRSS